jgi:gluconokinase
MRAPRDGFVVGLDLGTSSIKAVLYDARGRAVPRVAVHQPIRGSESSQLDADALCDMVVRALARLVRLAGSRRASRIAGAGASTFWHGLVAADQSARALTPLYLWSDGRSAATLEDLRAAVDAERLRQRTGCPVHPSYWPAKLHWLRTQRPDLWRRPVRWLSFGDLLYWRLFGRLGTSLSMASGTGLFRLDDCRWDADLMSMLGLQAQSLPPIARAERGLRPPYRSRLAALAEVPWTHAAGDGALANLGSGCTSPARRAITIGTSGALRAMHGPSAPAPPPGLWRYRLDESRLLSGGAINNGGNLNAWLSSRLRLTATPDASAPGAHGLTFLPHLFGERSLGYAADAFGAVAGLTANTSALDMAQAAHEAVAVQLAQINRRLDTVLSRSSRLVASGGALLTEPEWMQMVADASGRPVIASRHTEASSRGAALFAMELLGMPAPPARGAEDGQTFRPSRANSARYAEIEARQDALYRALIVDRILEKRGDIVQ